MTSIKRIGIVVNPKKKNALSVLKQLRRCLKSRNLKVVDDTLIDRKLIPLESDLIIALGGDGTLLNIVHWIGRRSVPVLGVNLGSLGFLTEFTTQDFFICLKDVLNGKYECSERMMLSARVMSKTNKVCQKFKALNDVVITKGELSRITNLDVWVDDKYLTTYTCDGLIISTPTGSTAHSLASGGPIIHPGQDVFVITPICPHTLSNRPLILPAKSEIIIRGKKESKHLYLTADGQSGMDVKANETIRVRKFPGKLKLIVSPKSNYFRILSQKLKWGGQMKLPGLKAGVF